MLHQLRFGKLFQVILTVIILGMTCACESEINTQTMLKNAETRLLNSEQRALAAEVRMNELSRKLQEAERTKTAAIEARQIAEQKLGKARGEVTLHTALNVVFFGLIIASFFAGLRQGERRRNDNDVISKSMPDDPYIEMYAQAANTGTYKPRSSHS